MEEEKETTEEKEIKPIVFSFLILGAIMLALLGSAFYKIYRIEQSIQAIDTTIRDWDIQLND